MKKIFFAFITLTLIFFNTCDENPVNGDNVKPGRRDYVWELDSLQKISPNYYSEIWGTSMDNLWLATDSYDLDKNLLHFNGEEWNKVATIPSPVQALSLFGLDETLAWIGGPYGDFWKYNGQTFGFYKSYHLQEFLLTYISDIWGNRANNLYAVGSVASLDNQHLYAFIMLYDGEEWRYLVYPSREEQFLKVMNGSNINSDLLVLSNYDDPNPGDIYRLYKYDGKNFQLLLDNSENPSDIPWFEKLGGDVFICFNKKLYSINNNKMNLVKNIGGSVIKYSKFFGRSINDLFFTGEDGIAHYNGKDVKIIYTFQNFKGIVKMILFEDSVAILCSDLSSFYVLRGKLQ